MINKARIMLLTFIIFITSAIVVSAGTETQITQNERLTSGSSFYGNYVYWTETDGHGVHAYDLTTEKRTDIDGHFAYNQIASYGNKVVWAGDDGVAVYMYDISTGSETKITPYGSFPDIYGNYVVYTNYYDRYHKNDSIYLYDINSGSEAKIASAYHYPAIYDKTVVWSQANSSNGYDICKYDITANQTSILTTLNSSIPEAELDIYGDTVVWTESHNLYMYNIASHKKTQITDGGTAYEPAIYGNWIAYEYGSGDNRGIYTYEISTARITRILDSNLAHGPSVYGNSVIYIDSRNPETDPDVRDIYLYNLSDTSTSDNIIAKFTSNVTLGFAPLTVSFKDISTGSPTSWLWDFGDGTTSTAQNPEHTYNDMGGYTVNLTVNNSISSSTTSTYGYILVGIVDGSTSPAYFSSSITNGSAPLTVVFHDDAEYKVIDPIWREWNFGDGVVQSYMVDANDSATPYAAHTYEKPGKYTVTLYLDNRGGKSIITKYNYITVTDPAFSDPATESGIPVANFTTNITEGYTPLSVQFNDFSRNATLSIWDFNSDGQIDSSDPDPVYMYTAPGTYTVNLTAINANGTSSKTATITVLESSSGDDSKSSGGSSHSSSSGGAGGSPEPAKNVEVKELSQVFITNGKNVKFDFTKNATAVAYISFDSKKTAGKTTTIIEMLKNKSVLTPDAPEGEIYNYLNIWVGNGGYGNDENNLENASICFRVEKSWAEDQNIDQNSIALNRYSDKKWNELPTTLLGEDDKYLYFTAKTPGFSPFSITGKTEIIGAETRSTMDDIQAESTSENMAINIEQTSEQNQNLNASEKEGTKMPGFEIVSCIVCLIGVFLFRRK
ncbi:MAG: PGF-pre-PGF protein [Euryarchaeota archaeon]|nr:PGF-pre-PGF protein [Euryarchaeota archaeon]